MHSDHAARVGRMTDGIRRATIADLPLLIELFRAHAIQMGIGSRFNESIVLRHLIECLSHRLAFVALPRASRSAH